MLSGLEVFNEAVWHGQAPAPAHLQHAPDAEQTFIRGMLEMPLQKENRNPAELVASLLFHLLIVAAVIIVPLLFTRTMDLSGLENTFLVAPPPPPAAPPQAAKAVRALARPIPQQAITQPVVIPAKIRIVHEAPPPDPGALGVIGGIPGGSAGGVLGGVIGGTDSIAPPPPPPQAHHENEILRVGGDVKPPQVIYAPAPVYPVLARTSRVEGAVTIDAVIDQTGHVVEARAISGPGLLLEAALTAVSQWRYQPTYLDGQAVSIRMHVTVKFHLE
ncbi:MAG TPA: energy transducer TonB [Candidatus Dormibacteraeota bacterium]|nr:energy transducer TonB [Candidatus Dormibacteraeota bacterium]